MTEMLPPRDPTEAVGIGLDFGTTNSVVALAFADGRVETLRWASGADTTSTFRSALCFWREGRDLRHAAGPEAEARAARPTDEQRFVQSLKTHLASRAFSDTRLYGRRFTIEALCGLFLRDLLAVSGKGPGQVPSLPLVAGRPVVFAGANADETLAVDRLQAAFRDAGLEPAAFAYEPLGAAYWYARDLEREETVLVADFGGGTSDFSILRFARCDGRLRAEPLAHSGVGVAGDTFDSRIVSHAVLPRLGKDATFRAFGGKALPIPAHIHAAFAQWHQLSWLKSGTILDDVRKMAETSDRGGELEDLATIVEMDMGLALYQAVGRLKADLSCAERAHLSFGGWGVSIEVDVSRDEFEEWIADDLARLDAAIGAALDDAGMEASAIHAVFMTGGTSHVPAVRRLFENRFPGRPIHRGDAFGSVASGLALMAADAGRPREWGSD